MKNPLLYLLLISIVLSIIFQEWNIFVAAFSIVFFIAAMHNEYDPNDPNK